MILLIDNYDSFTYNLVDYFKQLHCTVKAIKNDSHTLDAIADYNPEMIVLSPGPGRPEQAGNLLAIIRYFSEIVPILGICLGHQAIATAFGGRVITAPHPVHGKLEWIRHDNATLFHDLPASFQVTRYHSLVVERDTLPDCLTISAENREGLIMALRHKTLPIEGVQFHPEAILTQHGLALLQRFLTTYLA